MIELAIVENEAMSYQENLYKGEYLTNCHYSFSEDSFTLFSPKNDGEHQFQVTIDQELFGNLRGGFPNFKQTDEDRMGFFPAIFDSQLVFEKSPFTVLKCCEFGSDSPRFDLLSPEVTGYYRFLTSNDNLSTTIMVCFTEQYSTIMFPDTDSSKWPAIIYPSDVAKPAFLTHPPETPKEIDLSTALKQCCINS